MTKPVPLESLRKLALAGEQAGLTFEDMLLLLRSGLTIERLLARIEAGSAKAELGTHFESGRRRSPAR